MQGVTKGNENIEALKVIKEENEELMAKLESTQLPDLENENASLKQQNEDMLIKNSELRHRVTLCEQDLYKDAL